MDLIKINRYCKQFCDLTLEKEQLIQTIGPDLLPYLPAITEAFYTHLLAIDDAVVFLEGRVDSLKKTHLDWLSSLFTKNLDDDFAAHLYHVGAVHVRVELPADFVTGAITFLHQKLIHVVVYLYGNDSVKLLNVLQAINSLFGYNLQLMQLSYQQSMVTAELARFLDITGISHKLFSNMVAAYDKQATT
ncbi:protoglobin domain-containing protein [Thiofilum flexile]|uniref:protoglobin domain-containing protein n=1 Tax=Thiofilum flexile TaxID=125627 RepID=UPI000368B37C|nr:protoglobin domain-containing protein [Thiofilum flexile]